MRKVYAGLFSSIDGVVERPNEWQPAFDEEMGAALQHMLMQSASKKNCCKLVLPVVRMLATG